MAAKKTAPAVVALVVGTEPLPPVALAAPAFEGMAESAIFVAALAFGASNRAARNNLAALVTAVSAAFAADFAACNSDDAKRDVSKRAYVDAGEGIVISEARKAGLSGYEHASDTPEGVFMRQRVREWLSMSVNRVKDWQKTAGLSEAEKQVFKDAASPIGRVLKGAGLPNPNPRAARTTGGADTPDTPDTGATAEKIDFSAETVKAPMGLTTEQVDATVAEAIAMAIRIIDQNASVASSYARDAKPMLAAVAKLFIDD